MPSEDEVKTDISPATRAILRAQATDPSPALRIGIEKAHLLSLLDATEWRPISDAESRITRPAILIARPAILIARYPASGAWSDPVFGWRMGHGEFARWRHDFPPTHWMPPPAPPQGGEP